MEEFKKYLIWLSSISNIGSIKTQKLIEYFASGKNVWDADYRALKFSGILSSNDIDKLLDSKTRQSLEVILNKLYINNINVVTYFDDEYPSLLKKIYDPPIILYYQGNIENYENGIAIIGSRKASKYGLDMGYHISKELSKVGITVISGMARGIDSKAHLAALNEGGKTIAVLGCGLDICYPPENYKLKEKISQKGCVLSEYITGTPPYAGNFPARNRIISGLSNGVIVVEAGIKSGSLITVDFALEQGREVFALPGNVNSKNSLATNLLIKDGAKMVTSIDDILEDLYKYNLSNLKDIKQDFSKISAVNKQLYSKLDNDEKKVIDCLLDQELHIDEISKITNIEIKNLSAILVMLELNGLVKQSPGKRYAINNKL